MAGHAELPARRQPAAVRHLAGGRERGAPEGQACSGASEGYSSGSTPVPTPMTPWPEAARRVRSSCT